MFTPDSRYLNQPICPVTLPDGTQVSAVVPATACATAAGTCGLDIAAGVRAQLEVAGVRQAGSDGRCTRECQDLYSYRRDGRTGRSAGLIWLSA